MKRFVLHWAVIVIAVYIAAALLSPRIRYRSNADILLFSLVLGLLDTFIGPVLRVLTFPFTLLTFGLFSLIVNGFLFWMAANLEGHIAVQGFISAVLAAIVVSVVNVVVGHLV